MIINPKIPLEIFLPPDSYEHIHFVGNKDENGLNTGVFFLRVHEWSVRMLAKTVAFPMFRGDVDLGRSADQNAMAIILNESDFRSAILYQPRIWYNTYEFHHGYEGKKGNLLVHFPGLEDERWQHMSDWLDIVEGPSQGWEMDLDRTLYPKDIQEYWSELGHARTVLEQAQDVMGKQWRAKMEAAAKGDEVDAAAKKKVDQGLVDASNALTRVLETETDRLDAVRQAREALKAEVERVRAMLGFYTC